MAGDSDDALRRTLPPLREVSLEAGYAAWAPAYDADHNLLFPLEEAAVERLLSGLAARDALDAAAGTGRHVERLAALGGRVVAIDQSPEMLAAAIRKPFAGDVAFVRGQLDHLPLASERFDVVLCALALCHAPDLAPPLAELRRVIRGGGRFVITDFHPDAVAFGQRSDFRVGDEVLRLPNPQADTAAYLRAVEDAGFRLRSVEAITAGDIGWRTPLLLEPERRGQWPELNVGLIVSADAV